MSPAKTLKLHDLRDAREASVGDRRRVSGATDDGTSAADWRSAISPTLITAAFCGKFRERTQAAISVGDVGAGLSSLRRTFQRGRGVSPSVVGNVRGHPSQRHSPRRVYAGKFFFRRSRVSSSSSSSSSLSTSSSSSGTTHLPIRR
ncbi:hypothetical protein P5V15_001913 [Pogonomyrmex californicus]